MTTEFFVPMIPPTKTYQQKRIDWTRRRVYEDGALSAVRQKLSDAIGPYRPTVPYSAGVRLVTKWCFPCGKTHTDGEYRISKPDTDNLQKLLKDVMTQNRFWTDDALVASEIVEKFWARTPGIYIRIEAL